MLQPFREAVDYQLGRVPMTRKAFDELSDEAKRRAFTIAGLVRRGLLEDAYQLAYEATAEGLTKSEFAERLGSILDEQEGLLLRPSRIELIAQNNTAAAVSAGRWAQLTDPDVREERPYLQYPLGPSDASTSAICRRLEGFVARWDSPVWQHIYPPNHHNERHLQVVSLTEEDARASGKLYEGDETSEFPFVDGQRILPDPGFDFAPGSMTSFDDAALVEAARAAGRDLPAKTWSDYGLAPMAELVESADLPPVPTLGMRLNPTRLRDAAAREDAWESFREIFDIDAAANGTMVVDVLGEGVVVNRATFEHLTGWDTATDEDLLRKHDRSQWFPLLPDTLRGPLEVWMTPSVSEKGDVSWRRRYLAAFTREDDSPRTIIVFAEMSREGWLMESSFALTLARVDALRKGLLVYRKGGAR